MSHHDMLSPSVHSRREACNASGRMELGYDDSPSEHAAWGTVAHDIAHQVARGAELESFLGQVIECEGFDIEVTAEMIETVRAYIEHIRDLIIGADEWGTEVKVDLSPWIGPDSSGNQAAGTVDFYAIKEGVLYVRDLKGGRGVQVFASVDGKLNNQLMDYTLGINEEKAWAYDLVHLDIGIVQPRLDHIDTATLELDALELHGERLIELDRAIRQDGAGYGPGEDACRFCKARFDCRARAEWAVGTAGVNFDNLAGETTDVGKLTTDEKSSLLHRVKGFKAWLDDLEEACLDDMMAGIDLRDWKPVDGRGSRAWKDEAEAEKKLRGTFKLKLDECKPRSLLSPAQAEKAVGKDRKDKLAELIVTRTGKPTIALKTSKKASIAPKTDDFNDLTEDQNETE